MSGYDTRREAKSPEALRHLLATERDWHGYREPHMVALAQRLATANSIGTEQATSTLGSPEPGAGATQPADWHTEPPQALTGPQNAETEQ